MKKTILLSTLCLITFSCSVNSGPELHNRGASNRELPQANEVMKLVKTFYELRCGYKDNKDFPETERQQCYKLLDLIKILHPTFRAQNILKIGEGRVLVGYGTPFDQLPPTISKGNTTRELCEDVS